MQKQEIIQDENFPITYTKEYRDIYETEVSYLRWGWIRGENLSEYFSAPAISIFVSYEHPDSSIREATRVDSIEGDFSKLNKVLEEVVLRVHSKLFPHERK